MLVRGTVTVANTAAANSAANNVDKKVIFKSWAPSNTSYKLYKQLASKLCLWYWCSNNANV